MLEALQRRPDRVVLLGAGALTGLLLLGVLVSGLATEAPPAFTGWGFQDDGLRVLATAMEVRPGDTVRIDLTGKSLHCASKGGGHHACAPTEALGQAARFYVVESGEAQAFLQGRRPDHVVVEVRGATAWGQPLTFVRPPPPDGKEDLPTTWGRGGTTIRAPGIARPHGLELVWVLPGPPVGGVDLRPEDAAGSALDVQGAVRAYPPWLPAAQVALGVLQLAAAAAIVAGAVAWRRRAPDTVPAEARDTEALLHLMERALGYLQALRASLAVTGFLILVLGLGALAFVAREGGALATLSPAPAWPLVVLAGFVVALGALAVAWLLHYRAVTLELRRWRARLAAPPDLAGDR